MRPILAVILDFGGCALACSCCTRKAPKLKKGCTVEIPFSNSAFWFQLPCI